MLNSNGTPKQTFKIASGTHSNSPALSDYDYLGTSVANIGDIDGDGTDDIAVGAPGDGTLVCNDLLFQILCDDIAVGAPGDGTGDSSSGAIHIITLNGDGTPKQTVRIAHDPTKGLDLSDGDGFGTSVANIGDIDGDGTDDIAVGAYRDGTGGPVRGAVHIIMLNGDGTPKQAFKIASGTHSNSPALSDYDYLGSSVANIGDIDNNGINDIAVGAPGGSKIYILFLFTTPGKPTGLSATAGNAEVELSWSAPASTGGAPITDYRIEYSSDGSNWTTFDDGTNTATTATVTGLTNAQQYSFRVSATNSAGTGTASDVATATPNLVSTTTDQTNRGTLPAPSCSISLANSEIDLGSIIYGQPSGWATQTVRNDGNQNVTGMVLEATDWTTETTGETITGAYSQISLQADGRNEQPLNAGSSNTIEDDIPFTGSKSLEIKYRINLTDVHGGIKDTDIQQTVTYLATCS